MKNKTVVCRYKKCFCENKELDIEEAVKVGNSYYHPECYKTQEEIKEIISLFKEFINPNPVYAQLHRVINNIVFDKKLSSEFLLFGLRYYINKKIPLNYPQGLYYVIQNKSMLGAYQDKKKKNIISKPIEIINEAEHSFTYKPTKSYGIGDIIKE